MSNSFKKVMVGPLYFSVLMWGMILVVPSSLRADDLTTPGQSVQKSSATDALDRARSRLYKPPQLPADQQAADFDNVYSMQILALPKVEKMQALGRQIFFDATLSGSGKLSCASCHVPSHAYGPPDGRAVQPGGVALDKTGNRAVPSLRYRERLPAFTAHYYDEDHPTGIDQGPTGGFGWDGRFSTPHAQASLPLLSPNEMANKSVSDVVAKLRQASYAPQFRETFGADALKEEGPAFKWMTLALEYFQRDAKEFFPFSSKYDAYLRGQTTLSPAEAQGLKVFEDTGKGNCSSCHTSQRGHNGALPDFTDHGLVAIGVPRNPALSINHDPTFFDMGLCGPFRQDMRAHPEYCGAFRTPSLRNVSQRKVFFHNGLFHDLRDVLAFYATRDTNPGHWYPSIASGPKKGQIDLYNDLPEAMRKNINRDAPFKPDVNGKPRLSQNDIDSLIAFLGTLNDGFEEPLASVNGGANVKGRAPR